MCGFAGVIAWDEKYRVTRDTLEKMSRVIAHRGPDGEGYHLTRENEPITPDAPQVGLAFRRLAILDPDPRSNQPFHIGPLTLVFNGEIYNFKELKSEISKLRPDYRWRTSGDTEVLLIAYEVWREKCVEKLNGMFAFAVWDEQKKELFLARDRMGQKPLYMTGIRGERFRTPDGKYGRYRFTIAFASEIEPLMGLPWVTREINDVAIVEYLSWGYVPSRSTVYKHIAKLPARSGMIYTGRNTRGGGYYGPDVRFNLENAGSNPVIETRRRVLLAVSRQMVSDVPIGCFLSGGIDSSVIVAAMVAAAGSGKSVSTFSVGFEDPRFDETPYARRVAEHLGTDHHEIRIRPEAAMDLPRLAALFGEPFGDSSALPTHYLSRETRSSVKVALSGDGGDELFGGYERYRAILLAEKLKRLPLIVRTFLSSQLARAVPGVHPKSAMFRIKRFLGIAGLQAGERYERIMRLFGDTDLAELLVETLPSRGKRIMDIAGFRWDLWAEGRDEVQTALAADRVSYLPNDLLTKVDRCSMMHGLEVRSPFMDHELVQFAAGLTTDQLLKGGPKRMLREAFAKDLPDFVFKRKKMGFAVPIGEWFRGKLRSMLHDNLFASDSFGKQHFKMAVVQRLVDEHEQQRVDHSQRLYALLMLELWWQQQKR